MIVRRYEVYDARIVSFGARFVSILLYSCFVFSRGCFYVLLFAVYVWSNFFGALVICAVAFVSNVSWWRCHVSQILVSLYVVVVSTDAVKCNKHTVKPSQCNHIV